MFQLIIKSEVVYTHTGSLRQTDTQLHQYTVIVKEEQNVIVIDMNVNKATHKAGN